MTPARCTVATINILGNLERWGERRDLLVEGLADLQPDLIALQEVVLPDNNARWLADQLNRRGAAAHRPSYTVHLCPKTGPAGQAEALAILSRLPVERHDTLDLLTQNRVAQAVHVRLDGRALVFANGHFYWIPGESAERVRQVRRMLDWLETNHQNAGTPKDAGVVVCGDFNGVPESAAIRLMRETFASAHTVCHGCEPEYTCPTPLVRPGFTVRLGSFALNLLLNRRLRPWRGTLDYIFVGDRVRVLDCAVILNRPAPHDVTLYPSDHFGLAATLELDSPE